MSPGKAKYLAKAAKGYESHKKEKATTDMSKRIQRDLLPAIAAGQIDSLVQARVIPREKQKKLTKNMVKRQASTLRKTQKKDNKRKHKSKRSRRERDRHSKKKKKHRSWSSSSSDSSDTSSSSSLSSSSSSTSSSDSTSSSSSSSPGLARSKSKKSRRSKSKHGGAAMWIDIPVYVLPVGATRTAAHRIEKWAYQQWGTLNQSHDFMRSGQRTSHSRFQRKGGKQSNDRKPRRRPVCSLRLGRNWRGDRHETSENAGVTVYTAIYTASIYCTAVVVRLHHRY
jgi:hypothetical protein